MNLRRYSRAATGQQYAIMVGLVAVVALAAVVFLGQSTRDLMLKVGNTIETTGNGTAGAFDPNTPDSTPDAFSFNNQNGVTINTVYSSNAITLTGFNQTLTATCGVGCTDIARNGTWAGATTLSGFEAGDTIAIRQMSPAAYSSAVSASVSVGNTTSGSWALSTNVQDLAPDAFAFNTIAAAPTSQNIRSNRVTLTGFDGPLNASCNSGCVNIARNNIWLNSTNVSGFMPGDTIMIQLNTTTATNTTFTASVSVGQTQSATWSVTTALDTQIFTSSGTWTKPGSGTTVYVRCVGGGGGGGGYGGAKGTSGGGGGGSISTTIAKSSLAASQAVTIGAGGAAGGVFANGANGGPTSFASFTAGGGAGGIYDMGGHATGGAAGSGGYAGGIGGAGGIGPGGGGGGAGGMAGVGGAGGDGSTTNYSGPAAPGGLGGDNGGGGPNTAGSVIGGGGGGDGGTYGGAGSTGKTYGGGGGGAGYGNYGGAGASGICVITTI